MFSNFSPKIVSLVR